MSEYQSWMTKYRPSDFSHVVGQGHVVSILQGMLQKKALASSLIFVGGHGRGKTSLARLFAKAVLCHNSDKGSSCGVCPSCKAFLSDQNPNFIEKDAASTGKVADIRELLKLCSYPPMASSKRVILLDEAHKISSDGWDALLKTLEEAPTHTIFLFCTTEVEKVNATILSRSRTYFLNPITPMDIVSRLVFVLNTEGVEFEEAALEAVAEASDGHLRDALNLLEQVYFSGGITVSRVQALTHRVDSAQIKTCLQKLIHEPMIIFQEATSWMAFMSPEDVCISIQTLLTKHQLALWKVEPSNLIPGWGDVAQILQWLSSTSVPTTINQLNGFLIQLVSQIRPAAASSNEVPFTPTRVKEISNPAETVKEAKRSEEVKTPAEKLSETPLRPLPAKKQRPDPMASKKPQFQGTSQGILQPTSPITEVLPQSSVPIPYTQPIATPQYLTAPTYAPPVEDAPVTPAVSLGFNTPLEAPMAIPPGVDVLAMFAVTKPIPPVGTVPEEFADVCFPE